MNRTPIALTRFLICIIKTKIDVSFTETEEDLLDMAPFLASNSRLGCQITLEKEIDGIRLRLPRATKNFYVDGHKPQPH